MGRLEKNTGATPVGWIAKRVGEALKNAPIHREVVAVIETELRGRMQEHAIRSPQLDQLARSLIEIVNLGATDGPLQ